MRIFWLYAHPCPESFHGGILARGMAAARRAGHDVDLCDLNAENFDPVLRADARRHYHDLERNRQGVEPWIERLQRAEWIVCQFPVWCFGPPAILKGFFDRVLLPGVAFDLSDPLHIRSGFTHWRRVTGIASYGQGRLQAIWMGDAPRKLVTRYLAWYGGRKVRADHLAIYHMNTAAAAHRSRFVERVERYFAA